MPNPLTAQPVSFDDVRAAASRLRGVARRTPVLTCGAIDDELRMRLVFKCEHMQRGGAFKFRGAFNAVCQLDDEAVARGVVTHSSGNHGRALALAAAERGVPADIVMPDNAPAIKVNGVRDAGGRITFCRPTLIDRQRVADQIVAQTGATLIPPYNHPHVIAGQGTAAMEMIEDFGELDAIVAPVGGGGLLAGTAITARALLPNVVVLAGEPAQADDAFRSIAAGHIVEHDGPVDTIADGLKTSLGSLTFPIIQSEVHEVVRVSERQIIGAMRLIHERARIIVEPSAAVAMAVVVAKRTEWVGRTVGVILSGGNVDPEELPWRT